MYLALSIFAAVLGLAITGATVYTAWYVHQAQKRPAGNKQAASGPVESALLNWTVLDSAVLVSFGVGMVFLLVDLIAVMRDKDLYPPYHFGYLLSGFVFVLLAMISMFIRLIYVLRLAGSPIFASDQKHEPTEADKPKQRVKEREQSAKPNLANQVADQ